MKVTLQSTDNLQQYTGTNEAGRSIALSSDDSAVGPMQSVMMAAAGCSTIDIVMILQKMRQPIEHIEVEVEGKRAEDHPRIFTDIHMHYKLYGQIKPDKAERAIALSLEKYCSVSIMLSKSANITSSFEIEPATSD